MWEFAGTKGKEVDFKIKKIQNVEWNVRREMMEEMKTKRNSNHNGCEQQI